MTASVSQAGGKPEKVSFFVLHSTLSDDGERKTKALHYLTPQHSLYLCRHPSENRRWIKIISGNVYVFKSHLRKEKDEIRECQRWNREVFIILFNFISDMLTATFCWYFSIRLILISTFQFWQLQSRMLQNICEILAVFINSCKVEQRGKLAEQFSEGEDPKV